MRDNELFTGETHQMNDVAMKVAAFLVIVVSTVSASGPTCAFTTPRSFTRSSSLRDSTIKICEGVEFDKISREWRCKWSPDNDKAALVEAQKALDSVIGEIKQVDGVLGVERIVCGGCLDFKVVTTLPAAKFSAWEEISFAPEADFLKKLDEIDGISVVETQTYTKMPM